VGSLLFDKCSRADLIQLKQAIQNNNEIKTYVHDVIHVQKRKLWAVEGRYLDDMDYRAKKNAKPVTVEDAIEKDIFDLTLNA